MSDFFIEKALAVIEQGSGVRLDANETPTIERTLTQLRTKVLTNLYAPLEGRKLVPKATDIAADADTYSFVIEESLGKAKVGASTSDDPPRVGAKSKEETGKVYNITASFGYDILDIRRAARLGNPLSVRLANIARDVIERGIDDMIALGNTGSPGETNLITTGLLNNADVAALGIQDLGETWTSETDPDVILGVLNGLLVAPSEATEMAVRATDIVMPDTYFNIANTMRVGVDSDRTVLSWFLANNPGIVVTPWAKARLKGGSSLGRMMAFKKDPMILEGVIPMEFEMLPPQAKNYEFEVPCLARCGGVKIYTPVACKYADFTGEPEA